MKILSLIVLIFLSADVAAQRTSYDDSLCLEYARQATMDYEAGQLKFCASATWNLPFARMYDILDSLCNAAGVKLTPYPYEEHHYGFFNPYLCYSRFMDSVIKRKYGENFETHLYNLADSLFIVRHKNDTIPAYYCDKRAEYFKRNSLEKNFFKNISLPDSCSSLFNCKTCDYRVIFLVDLDGHASNYKIYHSDSSNKCNNRVDKAIIDALQKINKWRPGILGNRQVVSYGDLLINFSDRRII